MRLERKVRPGFTLIELLVVVAVIAILASLLLPALGASKSIAKRATCLGDMRQCGTGLFNYASDFGGWTPVSNANANGISVVSEWVQSLPPMIMMLGYAPVQGTWNSSGRWPLPMNTVYACPSLPPPANYSYAGGAWNTPSMAACYGLRSIDGGVCYYPGERVEPTLGRLLRLESIYSKAPYIGDTIVTYNRAASAGGGIAGRGQTYLLTFTITTGEYCLNLRHNRAADCWFIDGHAAALVSSDLQQIMQPTASHKLGSAAIGYCYE